MKWFLGVLLFLALLLSIDFSNALWEAKTAKQDLKDFLLVKEGTVSGRYVADSSCQKKDTCEIGVDLAYSRDDGKIGQTTFYLKPTTSYQLAVKVPLLCDMQQNMCLPRDYVHQKRSIWFSTYLSKLFY